MVEYPPPKPVFDPTETAQDRRRKAILAAFSSNTESGPTPPSLPSSSKTKLYADRMPAAQSDPNLPSRSSADSNGKKRSLPWEEELE